MKRVLTILLKTLIVTIILGIITISFIKSDYYKPFDKEAFSHLKEDIKNAEELPDSFYETYNNIKPMSNGNSYLISKITRSNHLECPCMYVAKNSQSQFREISFINKVIMGWKLEKELTQKGCLNFVVQEFDYVYGQVGIKNASNFYFEKEINSLNTKEYQTLVVMLQNPSLYNPKRYPEKLEAKLREL